MATLALVPVSEYLKTSDYEPDAEYVDGRIEERSMGEHDHSSLQRKLLLLLSQTSMEASFICYPERRVQVASERFRVPDLVLVRSQTPKERVIVTPPLLCIEILSPEDRMSRTLIKVGDYLRMGVPAVWIIDGDRRKVQVAKRDLTTEHSSGSMQVTDNIQINLEELFSVLA